MFGAFGTYSNDIQLLEVYLIDIATLQTCRSPKIKISSS
ncbi:hypothetical protein M7I_2401 [Glarea lozoyensis 74030]|uniref:Uncharacterized protein n=1 Tax=Glarea lozoyensis (strain ATCC 74030 / MF5533) TaxID=1104152 RepID=H0EIP0_GLAL7|nr:hypothetical protein M7I_2401 [Glarea lozoyensis 74030]